jgi:hypothetical protein
MALGRRLEAKSSKIQGLSKLITTFEAVSFRPTLQRGPVHLIQPRVPTYQGCASAKSCLRGPCGQQQ